MSSRALRRAQQQLEEERNALARTQRQHQEDDSDGNDGSEEGESKSTLSKANPFDMLHATATNEQDVLEEEDSEEDKDTRLNPEKTVSKPTTRKKGKKKKKAKANNKSAVLDTSNGPTGDMDDIDLALQSLSTHPRSSEPSYLEQLYAVLAVETQHLNVMNEMRRLFGRVVDQPDRPDDANPRRRRRGQQGQEVDIGEAMNAAHVATRGGLAGLGWRRNLFIKGKDEWPKAPTGGLSMEKVGPWRENSTTASSIKSDGAVEYKFVHSKQYQSVQQTFVLCVQRSDLQGVMNILHEHPYHISSLILLADIARQNSDPSRSSDLLERALFSFGRATHSTFSQALTSGRARLSFSRPENREFYLAAWRYMQNLGMKSTWRTGYEWAKLLLAINPEQDPYCVRLVIDQYALRARQFQSLIDTSTLLLDTNHPLWPSEKQNEHDDLSNMHLSTALALFHLSSPSHSAEARTKLRGTTVKYPWLLARLYRELNLPSIPACIWGYAPRTPSQHLRAELYVTGTKSIWDTPENTSFLTSVVESVERVHMDSLHHGQKEEKGVGHVDAEQEEEQISTDEARHTLLLQNPALDILVPPHFRQGLLGYDPLPPEDDEKSYVLPVLQQALTMSRASRDVLGGLDGEVGTFNLGGDEVREGEEEEEEGEGEGE